jgi:hypothetical protein
MAEEIGNELESLIQKESKKSLSLHYNLIRIRNNLQNPTFNTSQLERIIDDFETREGDIFLATYVKSGTTWTQEV